MIKRGKNIVPRFILIAVTIHLSDPVEPLLSQTKTDSVKRRKQQMRNVTADLKCGLRFDLSSTVKAPEVKVYPGEAPFF